MEKGKKGFLTIKKPWPGMLISLWNDEDRYKKTYWEKIPNRYYYFAGDFAFEEDDNYIWILGKI